MIYYTRKSPRIPMYDYSSCNYYFITICTHNRLCLFGSPDHLSEFGQIAKAHLEQLSSHYDGISVDKYVVMPNHIHMILILPSGNQYNLNQIIGQYKSGVTRMIRKIHSGTDTIWQRSYHDHIIRNQKDYEMIWLYIHSNPANWKKIVSATIRQPILLYKIRFREGQDPPLRWKEYPYDSCKLFFHFLSLSGN